MRCKHWRLLESDFQSPNRPTKMPAYIWRCFKDFESVSNPNNKQMGRSSGFNLPAFGIKTVVFEPVPPQMRRGWIFKQIVRLQMPFKSQESFWLVDFPGSLRHVGPLEIEGNANFWRIFLKDVNLTERTFKCFFSNLNVFKTPKSGREHTSH